MFRKTMVSGALALPLLVLSAPGCGGGSSCADEGTCAATDRGDAGVDGSDAGGSDRDASQDAGAPGCVIGGTHYDPGAVDPANECESCQPDVNAAAWSNLANGAACGDAGVCFGGSCSVGCYVNGSYYGEGAANPANACQTCQSAASTTTWGYVPDGTSCGCTQDSQCPQGDFCWVSACRKATAIAAGVDHACAVTTGGAVQCWGSNEVGQLGNGSTNSTYSDVPVAVSNLPAPVTALAAGDYFTCAVTTAGAVLCWGLNSSSQLGNGSTTDSDVPVAVSNLSSGVTAISAGYGYACALTSGGAVQCWGSNESGQLGGGTSATSSEVPVTVLASGATAISAGLGHVCAVTTTGGVFCWGDGTMGDLGNGSESQSASPVPVSNLPAPVTALAAGGESTCALTTAGAVLCWGDDTYGELGNASTTASDVPVAVVGLSSGVTAIAAGELHACALTTMGKAVCWGYNQYGQLGDGTFGGPDACSGGDLCAEAPVTVSGLSGATAIAAGNSGDFTCALTAAGEAQCWGMGYGTPGDASTAEETAVPVAVVEP